ncbi:acyltransferase family protein [Streptomyces vilmorinianum]|uniref:acyltransferase family protein n=1 Tax=Streptomyces vilmorinianum TaxID=3051092 RepID=UPI0010FB7BC2|nr:acyltransferase [Streptomyces vilmorinianum]
MPGTKRARSGGEPANRLFALDGIRITAALIVVFYHYIGLNTAWDRNTSELFPALRPFAVYGWLGVEIFFIVSGFVICMSVWGRTVGDFAVSRVSRLFPAYWAGIALTALTLWLLPEVRQLRHMDQWSDVLVNLTMMQGGLGVGHVDHSYWTLFVELKFYALFALVVLRGVTYRNCILFCGIWTLAAVAAPTTDLRLLHFFAMPQYAPYFIAGIAFYLMRRYRPTMLLWGIVGVQFLLAQHYVRGRMETNLGLRLADQLPTWPARLVIAVGFLAIAAVALGLLDRIQWRWLKTAGAITYPLYVIHMAVGITLIHHFRDRVAPVPLVVSVTAAMLVASWLIHRLVERPLSKRLRSGMKSGVQEIRRNTPAPRPADPAPAPSPSAVSDPDAWARALSTSGGRSGRPSTHR